MPARRIGRALGWCLVVATLAGCAMVSRTPLPAEQLDSAQPYGIDEPLVRFWGDRIDERTRALIQAEQARRLRTHFAGTIAAGGVPKVSALAVSGGGADGAFGAGVLAGWTERGDRPEFQLVSGVSTGAIIALFAFLGPDHDDTLREVYTTYSTEDIATPALMAGLTGGMAVTDTARYRAMIERYVTPEVMARIAAAYAGGRVLLIGTTNIDASRPVMWNIGGIAASGSPYAERLVEDVIQASSAIPGFFPPVLIPVTGTDGRPYDEMHVDGGATQQVMLYSPELRTREADAALGVRVEQEVWVIVNNKLEKSYDPVRPRLLPIVSKAASSLIGGSGGGDLYRIWAIAQRDGIAVHALAIPPEFDREPAEPFDREYMVALYALGLETGRASRGWIDRPPGFDPPAPVATATAPCGCDVTALGRGRR